MAGIFNRSIFNNAIFNTAPIPQTASGGWALPLPHRSRDRVREERERLGILPKRIQAVARRVLKRHVDESLPEIEEAFLEALEAANHARKELYIEVLRNEVMRIRELQAQEDEEETLLFM